MVRERTVGPMATWLMLNNGYERIEETDGGAPTKLRSPSGAEVVHVDYDRGGNPSGD